MAERILILLLVAAAVAAAWGMLRLWRAGRVAGLAHQLPLAGIVPAGKPAVVAFTSPGCHECRSRQAPALARLAADLGDRAVVHTLAAPEHPDLTSKLGILTVPATVVVDERGVVRRLNLGFAPAEQLAEQLRSL
jgi:thiol-disulfide isomerase/thioredoxin